MFILVHKLCVHRSCHAEVCTRGAWLGTGKRCVHGVEQTSACTQHQQGGTLCEWDTASVFGAFCSGRWWGEDGWV